jgi:fructosamine-3-kinase
MVNKASFWISNVGFEFWKKNGAILLQTMIIMSPFPYWGVWYCNLSMVKSPSCDVKIFILNDFSFIS